MKHIYLQLFYKLLTNYIIQSRKSKKKMNKKYENYENYEIQSNFTRHIYVIAQIFYKYVNIMLKLNTYTHIDSL